MHNLKPDTKSWSPGLRSVRRPGPPSFCSPASRLPGSYRGRLGLEPGEPLRRLRARARAPSEENNTPTSPPALPRLAVSGHGGEYAVFGGNSRPLSEPLLLSLASNTRVGSLKLRQLTPATYGVQLIWYETSTNLSQTTDIGLRPLFTDNGYPTFKAFSRGLLFFFHRTDWYYPASKSVIVSFK